MTDYDKNADAPDTDVDYDSGDATYEDAEDAPGKRGRFSPSDLPIIGRVLNRHVAKLIDFTIAICLFAYRPFLGAIAAIIYLLVCDGFKWGATHAGGQSIGKKLSGVVAVSIDTGAPVGYAESAVRNAPFAVLIIAYLLIGWIPYVGKFVVVAAAIAYVVYEIMQMNVDGLRLGDRLAKTRVVDADESAPEDF